MEEPAEQWGRAGGEAQKAWGQMKSRQTGTKRAVTGNRVRKRTDVQCTGKGGGSVGEVFTTLALRPESGTPAPM